MQTLMLFSAIGLFIVPCVPYLTFFIVEILYGILYYMLGELFAVWYDDAKASLRLCRRVVIVNTIDIVQCFVTI